VARRLRVCREGWGTPSEVIIMTRTGLDVFDNTTQKTNEWLRDISQQLGVDNRRLAYLALRGTLHAVRDFLPLDESAQLSAQLPMLVRGLYFEGWNPSRTPEVERSQESFLSRVDEALERALWNEEIDLDAEQAARAVLRVLSERVSDGEIAQVRHVLPEHVRNLWPVPAMSR
jgi:uncharacterized protein (DUF2267 family)